MAGDVKRAQAAELFVQAMQTGNIGTRKQLLLSSRQLLLDVRNNYPEAGAGQQGGAQSGQCGKGPESD